MKLYKFFWDCGRMGHLDGLFIAEDEAIEKIMGQSVYFGEVLGKHSEIYGDIEEDSFELISDDQEKIKWLIETLKCHTDDFDYGTFTVSGYNPFEYFEDYDDEDEEFDDE